MARAIVDIGTLDQLLHEELGSFESAEHFSSALWRQDPNGTGANWNARISRIRGNAADTRWWDVVPKLRETFSLVDEGD
jgi:hypothetical protein